MLVTVQSRWPFALMKDEHGRLYLSSYGGLVACESSHDAVDQFEFLARRSHHIAKWDRNRQTAKAGW